MAIDTTGISYINYLWTKKNADGTLTGIRLDKLNLPTNVAYLSDIPTDYVTIGTAQTITGFKTFSAPNYISGVEQTTMKIKTSNGGSITFGKQDKNSGSMIRLDQTDGTCRLRLRGSQVDGTLIWEQPETDSALYMDVEKIHFRGVDAFYLNKTIAADYLYTSSTGLVTAGTFKTLTIQKNGTNVATFKGNSNNTTANITIATTDVNNSSSNVDGDTVNDVLDSAKAIRSSDGSINISLTNGYVDFKVASAPISINLNGSATSNPSFYAPTSAGTSNYILKSNGSGAPTWIAQSSLVAGSASKVTNELTFGSKTYDGSSAQTLTLSDLGGQAAGSYVSYTNNTATVAGTSKTVSKISPATLFVPSGLIMGGTAASAGLVTRGICGCSTPENTGAATKSQLYLNYDGNNTNNPSERGVVINAGAVGTDLGSGIYSYCAVRGDAMKSWIEAKDYISSTTASNTYAPKNGGVYFVEGNTSGTAGTWIGSSDDITAYYDGLVVAYKIGIAGASTTTLNINSLGAKTVYLRSGVKLTTHYGTGTVILLAYNAATGYFYAGDYDSNTNTIPSAISTTSAGTAAKVASCTSYVATAKTYIQVILQYANTYKGLITLNVNGQGAKRIYINNQLSSSTNYTLPAGSYLVYYDGSYYYFYTDGNLYSATKKVSVEGHTHTYPSLANSDYITANSSGQLTSGTARSITAGTAINLDIVDGNLQISSDTLSVTSSGSGNAVTGITVNGHAITLTKNKTFLTSVTHPITKGTVSSGHWFNLHGEFDNCTIILFPTGSSNSFSVSFDSTGSSPITVYGFLICSHYSTPGLVRYFNSSGVLKSASPDAITVKSQVVYIKF